MKSFARYEGLDKLVHIIAELKKQAQGDVLSGDERAEFIQLRKDNKRLQMEREILKKVSVDSSDHRNTLFNHV